MPQREVFLSHSSRDRKFASELAEVLRGHGIPVWYSKTHIRGGPPMARRNRPRARKMYVVCHYPLAGRR